MALQELGTGLSVPTVLSLAGPPSHAATLRAHRSAAQELQVGDKLGRSLPCGLRAVQPAGPPGLSFTGL